MSTNPRHWSKKTRVIACLSALAIIVVLSAGAFIWHGYAIKRDCKDQSQKINDQSTRLTNSLEQAKDTLASIDPPKDGQLLAHSEGFKDSDNGAELVKKLSDSIEQASKIKSSDVHSTCTNSAQLKAIKTETSKRDQILESLDQNFKSLKSDLDSFRLDKASKQATSDMQQAKSDLENAIKSAEETLKAGDDSGLLDSNAEAKAIYDELKTLRQANSSDEVKIDTYDNAVSSIKRAKDISDRVAKLTELSQKLSDALNPAPPSQQNPVSYANADSSAVSGDGGGGGDSSYTPTGGCVYGIGENEGLTQCGSFVDPNNPPPGYSATRPAPKPYTGPPMWTYFRCPNEPGIDTMIYRSTSGWTQESASAHCGAPVRPVLYD